MAIDEITLEFTPTWIVASVCSVIIFVSLFAERFLHYLGKALKKKHQNSLFQALQKVKEELMLLGFISLLLTVLQGSLQKICISEGWTAYMLPCREELLEDALAEGSSSASGSGEQHCRSQGKVPLLSIKAIHQLHIFIFVLAVTHAVCSLLTMVLGGAKIRLWKRWEDSIQKEIAEDGTSPQKIVNNVQQNLALKRNCFMGFGKDSCILRWVLCFFKQYGASVTKSDYTILRQGFITTHCKGNPEFNFHKYMVQTLEADFKKVVGISWYLWILVIIFLLVNVSGWHAYFWMAFIPFILVLIIGTKLEHVITHLVLEIAAKHSAIEDDLMVQPSDDHFWFHRPRIVLHLIHFILFQNAFEFAYFFWILTSYGFDSCIMDHAAFAIPRLVIGVISQLLCSYGTLPLYAIATQMGSSFPKDIFKEHVRQGLIGWATEARQRIKMRNEQ